MKPRIFLLPTLLIMLINQAFCQELWHVEPPNWWIGMKNPKLQLMIHGPGVGGLKVSCDTKDVYVIKSITPDNPNYLFVDLEINPNTKPGIVKINLKKDKNTIYSIDYQLNTRETGSGTRKGYNSEDVIYLITPDRFVNGDPKNDRIEAMKESPDRTNKNARHGGDLQGIENSLDYLSSLGISAIWLNPFLENNMDRYSYHGYATTDFYKTDPRMGTNESFRQFCQEAENKGIKIIMDQIVNHCGLNHWWIQDPPTTDWINYQDQPYTETNHIKSLPMDPHGSAEDRKLLEDGWFVRTMPDLNVRNPFMAKYLIQNSIWWIEFAGLRGVRMDTYPYPEEEFMSEWAGAIMNEYPGINITGEIWHLNPAFIAYWQDGYKNTEQDRSHLPSVFDFPTQAALVKALMTPPEQGEGWFYLYETIAQDFLYPDPDNLVVFGDNHDTPRLMAQLGNDAQKVKLAMTFLLTTRGIPQIYYGTEVLMTSPASRDDGMTRSDFPGGWEGDLKNAFTGKDMEEQELLMQTFTRQLLQWRKNASAVHHGQLVHYIPRDGVYVYFRSDAKQKIMIILNKNTSETTLDLSRFKSELETYTGSKEIISGRILSLGKGQLTIPSGPMILELSR